MNSPLEIIIAENINDFNDAAIIRRARDHEHGKSKISLSSAFDKIIRLRKQGNEFWIAKISKEPVGYAFGKEHGRLFKSNNVYVLPDFRKHGIGHLLVLAQIDFSKRQGYKGIYSYVESDNHASIRMLEKSGLQFQKRKDSYYCYLYF